jgi:putative glutamine amidotransferase
MIDEYRPIIGVTGPDHGGTTAWCFAKLAIWLAGGHAVRITPKRPRSLDGLHGLIIGGGADVSPTLYGKHDPAPIVPEKRAQDEPVLFYLALFVVAPLVWLARRIGSKSGPSRGDVARDGLESALIDQGVARRLPILGICRGAQLLNVRFGGTLHQNLVGFYVEEPEVRTFLPRKQVTLIEGCTIARIIQAHTTRVNALHRQAIGRLGHGIRVAARDRNGIVQAIEHDDLPFVLGVQWHPEYLPQVPGQRELFCELVRQAKQVRGVVGCATPPAADRLVARAT